MENLQIAQEEAEELKTDNETMQVDIDEAQRLLDEQYDKLQEQEQLIETLGEEFASKERLLA